MNGPARDGAPSRDRVVARLDEWGLRGAAVVAAVSGGGDSVALLRLLHEAGARPVVAHLDHGVRGEAGAEDARFVASLAEGLGLPREMGSWQPTRAGHFEADARRARYAWLLEVARRRGAAAVAVGHTRDDQAETILHRIVRGTGVEGLAGMATSRPLGPGVALVRPLLGLTRAELRDYLGSIGQPWREDASNDDTRRTRARLRHDLLPRLAADYNPGVVEALARLGELAAEQSAVADEVLDAREAAAGPRFDDAGVTLDREALARMRLATRAALLRRLWRRLGWPEGAMSAARWRRLARAVDDGASRFDVGSGVVATVGREDLRLERRHGLCSDSRLAQSEADER